MVSSVPEFKSRPELWAILGSMVLFAATFELVRRDRLKERYSFLWMITAGVLTVFTLRRDWLDGLSRIVGIYYPPTALLLLLVFFMLLILLHFSITVSRLLNDKQILTQDLGILEARVRELETDQRNPT